MRIARRLQFLKLPIMVSIQLRRFHFLLTYLKDFYPPPGRPCLIAFFFQSTTGSLKESLIEALMR
ncbi:hypothetical protein AD936_16425 [Gluconobacter japonicus]|nr:hypothetical protein AD936_16425 [Gluconobacter japonicus]